MKSILYCCLVLLASPEVQRAVAQPAPHLTRISREWFQRGTTNEITLTGENLGAGAFLRVSGDPGVSAAIVPIERPKPTVGIESSAGGISLGKPDSSKEVRARICVASNASLNSRELRLGTPQGVSNPLAVHVSPFTELLESQAEKQAQRLDLPVGVSGAISAPGEVDQYSFHVKAKQEIIIDVLAFRTGSPLDSSLAVLNSAGKELARSEDARGFDSFLHFIAPEDGDYLIQLRDFRYGGSVGHTYHLTVGAVPCVDWVFPTGGRRGQAVDVALHGCNLGGVNSLTLHPEADAPLGWQEVRVTTTNGLSLPFAFEVTDRPEFVESEPNDSPAQANNIGVPAAVNGRLNRPKDVDTYKFKLAQPRTLICEVTAQRFGSPVDSLLTLRDGAGKILQENDDANGADARIEYAFQKDVEYTLSIRDLLGRGGDEYIYRLSIRPPQPTFSVGFSPDTPLIRCGGRTILHCRVSREAGFGGPVQIEAEDLPKGVTAEPVLVNSDDPTTGLLMLNAENNVAGGVYPIHLVAKAVLDGKRVRHAAEPLTSETPVRETLLTVVDKPAPFGLELLTLSVLLEQEQSAILDVLVPRLDGFDGEVKLTVEGYGAGRNGLGPGLEAAAVTVKASEQRASVRLKANSDAANDSRPIYVRGEAMVDGHPVVQYSQAIPLAVRQLPFTLTTTMKRLSLTMVPPGVTSEAGEAEFAVRASRRGWFTDQINLALEGLPEGVLATSTNLPNRVGEVSFKLTATEKAVPKDYHITVVGSGNAGGREYQQKTESILLSVAKAQEVADKQ